MDLSLVYQFFYPSFSLLLDILIITLWISKNKRHFYRPKKFKNWYKKALTN
nr:MAG TPA: hypothetical protein [Caudoviricetes sp.]